MSIAQNFRRKMDVALASADASKGQGDDARRASLARDIDQADLLLVEKAYVATLFETIEKLRDEKP